MRALGGRAYLVAEADESDRSFLKLMPILAVVTNLDREHMDTYRDMDDVKDAFVEFMNKVPFYGAIVACADNDMLRRDPAARAAQGGHLRRTRAGGLPHRDAAEDAMTATRGFCCMCRREQLGPFELNVPGHAQCAECVGRGGDRTAAADTEPAKIVEGVGSFRGVDRRFQQKGERARRDGGGRLRTSSD